MTAVGIPTDVLVEQLVAKLAPVPRSAVALRLAAGVSIGAAISVVLCLVVLGPRHDLAAAVQTPLFWAKLGYMVATAATSLLVAVRLAKPGSSTNIAWILAVPLLAYAPAAVVELVRTDPAQWGGLFIDHGWKRCTYRVLVLSLPVYAGIWWAFRSFAPTRMNAAGAITALCASAVGAVVYCLHCLTDTPVYVIVWFGLAFAIATIFGRAFGNRLLHW